MNPKRKHDSIAAFPARVQIASPYRSSCWLLVEEDSLEEHDESGERQRHPVPPPGEIDPNLIEVLYKNLLLKKQEKNGETGQYYREYKASE